jgi:hypothetical protein
MLKHRIKNDIIILFSDAEELGLNGAALFNATGGRRFSAFLRREVLLDSYMLMETNAGNAGLVKFALHATFKLAFLCTAFIKCYLILT